MKKVVLFLFLLPALASGQEEKKSFVLENYGMSGRISLASISTFPLSQSKFTLGWGIAPAIEISTSYTDNVISFDPFSHYLRTEHALLLWKKWYGYGVLSKQLYPVQEQAIHRDFYGAAGLRKVVANGPNIDLVLFIEEGTNFRGTQILLIGFVINPYVSFKKKDPERPFLQEQ